METSIVLTTAFILLLQASPSKNEDFSPSSMYHQMIHHHHNAFLVLPEPNDLTKLPLTGKSLFYALTDEDEGETITDCQRDALIIFSHSQTDDWAKKYLDAAGTEPSGFMSGNYRWLGDFDQCRSIGTIELLAETDEISLTPQYCRLDLLEKKRTGKSGNLRQPAVSKGMTLGFCAPISCKVENLSKVIEPLIQSFNMELNPDGSRCILQEVPFSTMAIVTISTFSVVGSLLVIGFLVDISIQLKQWSNSRLSKPPSKLVNLLICFSPYSNFVKLMKITSENGPSPNLSALNGIRALSLFWIILGHTYLAFQPIMDNAFVVPSILRRISLQFILAGALAVDSFFFLGGFLVYWSLAKQFRGRSVLQFLKSLPFIYFHRYVRLTPPLIALILISLALWPHLGSGPNYTQDLDYSCAKNWWVNLLYVNNFVDIAYRCVGWTWYLAVDMQLFFFAPFVVYLLASKKPMFGWVACFTALTLHIACNMALTFTYTLPSTGFFRPTYKDSTIVDNKRYDLADVIYIKPYTRAGPYVIGILMAHLAMQHGSFLKDRVFNKLFLPAVMWPLSLGVMLTLTYSRYDVFAGAYYNPTWADALANSLTTPGWGLALGWIVLACAFNSAGPIGTILSWPLWSVPARLSYCGYLIHMMVQLYYIQTSRRPFNVTDMNIIFLFFSSLFATILLAIPFTLAFEAPIIGLQRILVKSKSAKPKAAPETFPENRQIPSVEPRPIGWKNEVMVDIPLNRLLNVGPSENADEL